jgi:hypothetical protein
MNGSRICGMPTQWSFSATRKNDLWFEGKWMQFEDIMLSEVSHAQKDKGQCFVSYMVDRFKT